MENKNTKATAYQTKTETVFGNFPNKKKYSSTIMANGNPLNVTFKSNWYQVDGELFSLEEVWKEQINKRYELINKDLYNEKIPMIIDDSTQEKFQSLIDNNLYETVYDEKEIRENIPFKIIKIDLDTSINLQTIKQFKISDGFYEDRKVQYIISLLEHSTIDQCLIPTPLLDMTRPCALQSKNLFMVLSDMIASHKPNNYRISENTEGRFEVIDINKVRKLIIWEYYNHKAPNNYFDKVSLIANNYSELIEKLKAFVDHVINKLSEGDNKAISVALEELNQGRDFRKEEFDF